MADQKSSFSIVLKVASVVAILVAIGWAVLSGIRNDARVIAVARGKAVDAVTGSVVVHAENDLFELKSEVAGTVESCPGLNTAASFKKGDILVQLDSRDMQRAFDAQKREYENGLRAIEV